ncbi:MAG: hypothetical protein ACK5HT_10210 [Draconibacterium sp.]
MKQLLLKLKPILFLFVLFSTNCHEKESWVEIETIDNRCFEITESLGIISNVEGKIEPFNNEFIIVVKDILGYSEIPLHPCNVAFSDLKVGHRIIISGEVLNIEDYVIDSIASSLAALPIVISNAKIYK